MPTAGEPTVTGIARADKIVVLHSLDSSKGYALWLEPAEGMMLLALSMSRLPLLGSRYSTALATESPSEALLAGHGPRGFLHGTVG